MKNLTIIYSGFKVVEAVMVVVQGCGIVMLGFGGDVLRLWRR